MNRPLPPARSSASRNTRPTTSEKKAESGAYGLLVDYEWCTGCHTCEVACQMEHNLPTDQFGIKIAEVGPWEYAPDQWQYDYVAMPTNQCDFCASRLAEGKLPTCVHHCQSKCLKFGPVETLASELTLKSKIALFRK